MASVTKLMTDCSLPGSVAAAAGCATQEEDDAVQEIARLQRELEKLRAIDQELKKDLDKTQKF